MIVAIDGPAASGKSTVAKGAAVGLGFRYLDTGAMYRAVAYKALREGVLDDDAVARLAESADIRFQTAPGEVLPHGITIDGEDVTLAIRTPEVDANVSAAACIPAVREALVAMQRRMSERGDWVVEGRDIGTVVFPEAAVKVFLTASAGERARRRHDQHRDAGHGLGETDVLRQLERRDRIDSTREASPLAVAPDAVELDTTALSADAAVGRVISLVEERR